jgi:hypothetical protein
MTPKPDYHPRILEHDALHGRGAKKIPLLVINNATLNVLKRIKEWWHKQRRK